MKIELVLQILSYPIMLFIAGLLVKIGKALVYHEKRHALIAGYIIQLCASHGIKCKEDSV